MKQSIGRRQNEFLLGFAAPETLVQGAGGGGGGFAISVWCYQILFIIPEDYTASDFNEI